MSRTPPNELEPMFEIQVTLDGDDWPPTSTENARYALNAALNQMVADGLIRAFTLEPAGLGSQT